MSAGQGSPSSLGPRGREARGVGFHAHDARGAHTQERLPHEDRGSGGAVLIPWPRRLRPGQCDPPKAVEELINESRTKRRG